MKLIYALLAFSSPAFAQGFDWGSDCDYGSGEFRQDIPHQAIRTVGEIPAGKKDLNIRLNSQVDVDVQLIDVRTGTEIIAWPNGLLNGAEEACTTFEDVRYCYSGYNGTNGQKGNEWIRVDGATNRPVTLRAFGYAAGTANVDYKFAPLNTCNESGDGTFTQPIAQNSTIHVGEIPGGKTNVRIELDTRHGRDVDVQLWDGATPIIAWPNGQLNGPDREEITYRGARIVYSGYNGINGDKGHESIEIWGRVPGTFEMKAFGYRAGRARVDYEWGVGTGDTCGGIGNLACDEGLVCKAEQPAGYSDPAGECHTETWCLSAQTAEQDCANLHHVALPGQWTCSNDFTCFYDTAHNDPPECLARLNPDYASHDTDICSRILFVCEPGKVYFGDECGCGCECPQQLDCMPSTNGPVNEACHDLDAFRAACPLTLVTH